jgi:CDP-diacylglycerol--glycerol-3-phosphate 3-phosphatidyltransferase
LFSRLLQASVRAGAQRFAAAARLVKFSPNLLTLVGLVITFGAATLIAFDQLLWAGVALLLAGSFDILDGAVARASGRINRFGAFLDSTADRYGEGAVYIGFLYLLLMRQHHDLEVFLIAAALLGALLVSYVRARAQSLGFTCERGWFARPERVVVTALGLMVNHVTILLWILAIATNFTALQRIHEVWSQYRSEIRGEAKSDGDEVPSVPPVSPPQTKGRRGAAPSSPGTV